MLIVNDCAFEYETADQDAAYVEVFRAIEARKPTPTREQWESHWSGYYRPTEPTYLDRESDYRGQVFRLNGRFIRADRGVEARYAHRLRARLYAKYLSEVDCLAEFGCGSGNNLRQFGEAYPDKWLLAFDWSMEALRVASQNPRVRMAQLCDMRQPANVEEWLPKDCRLGVLTHGSMEQLGNDYLPFLDFLARVKPAVCVHVEPCVELYDETKLFDLSAAMYHRSRGYLAPWIGEVEKRGEVLLKTRTYFGNIYNEGYGVVVWRPTP